MVKKRKQLAGKKTPDLSHTSQRALDPVDQLLKNADNDDSERQIKYLFLALKYINFQRSSGFANREILKAYYEKEDEIFNQLENNLTAKILLKEETLEESLLKQIFLSNTDLLAEAYDQRSEEGLNIFNLLSSKLKLHHKIVVEKRTFYLEEQKEDGEKIELASVSEPIIHMIKRAEKEIPIQRNVAQGDIVSPSRRRTGISLMEQIRAANGQAVKKTGIRSPRAAFLKKKEENAKRPGFFLTDADVKNRKGALKKAATDSRLTTKEDRLIDEELAEKLAKRRGNKLQRQNAVMTPPVQTREEGGQPEAAGDGRIASLSSVDSQASTLRVASEDDMRVDDSVDQKEVEVRDQNNIKEMSREDYLKVLNERMKIQRLLADGEDGRDPNNTPEPRSRPKSEMLLETPTVFQPSKGTPLAPKRTIRREPSSASRERTSYLREMLGRTGGHQLNSPEAQTRFSLLDELQQRRQSEEENEAPVPPRSIVVGPRMFRGRGRGTSRVRGRGRGASLNMKTPPRGPRTPKRGR